MIRNKAIEERMIHGGLHMAKGFFIVARLSDANAVKRPFYEVFHFKSSRKN